MAGALAATRGIRNEAIAKLVAQGMEESRAALGVDLLPIAFGWVAMRKMGVRHVPDSLVLRVLGAEDVEHPVAECPLFNAAYDIANDLFDNGFTDLFPHSVVEALCFSSADVKALTKALGENENLNLGEIEFTSVLFGYTPQDIEEIGW